MNTYKKVCANLDVEVTGNWAASVAKTYSHDAVVRRSVDIIQNKIKNRMKSHI